MQRIADLVHIFSISAYIRPNPHHLPPCVR